MGKVLDIVATGVIVVTLLALLGIVSYGFYLHPMLSIPFTGIMLVLWSIDRLDNKGNNNG